MVYTLTTSCLNTNSEMNRLHCRCRFERLGWRQARSVNGSLCVFTTAQEVDSGGNVSEETELRSESSREALNLVTGQHPLCSTSMSMLSFHSGEGERIFFTLKTDELHVTFPTLPNLVPCDVSRLVQGKVTSRSNRKHLLNTSGHIASIANS